jgi:hypothetical protein
VSHRAELPTPTSRRKASIELAGKVSRVSVG